MTSVKTGHGGQRKIGLGRYVLGGLIALVLALFSGVIWFAYQDLMPGDEAPPLVRADTLPIKREPEERGGLPLVNEESVVVQALDEPDSPVRVERILPRETIAPRSTADVIPQALEAEPVPEGEPSLAAVAGVPPPAVDAADGGADTLDTLLAEIVGGEATTSTIAPAAGPADPAAALPLPADGAGPPEISGGEPPSPTPAASAAAPTPAPDPTPELAERHSAQATADAAATPPAAAPAAAASASAPAATTVAALPSPALAPTFSGAFGVQLLAVRDEAAAAAAWTSLQQQHPTVLGTLRSRVQAAEVGGDVFYRLQAGPFVDREGASAVCAALQSRGTDCFVVEPAT